MMIKKQAITIVLGLATGLTVSAADYLSPNGYSGLGLIPSASVLTTGVAVLNYDTTLPGARNTDGHNIQIGLGLFDNFELVGRLATNDVRCNMFRAGACPADNIRDFSAGLKFSLPLDWLKDNGAKVSAGINDAGGAASYFKSYYVVGSKSFGDIDVTLGRAKAMTDYSILDGTFGGVTWNVNDWSQLSLQRVGNDQWAHAAVSVPITDTGVSAWFNYNRNLNDSTLTGKTWTGVGISVALDRVEKLRPASRPEATRKVQKIDPQDLISALEKNGFYGSKLGHTPSGKVVLQVENTAYHWNVLDAAGVALGLVASAYGGQEQDFDLIVTTRGIQQILLSGDAKCAKSWLESDSPCEKLEVQSLTDKAYGEPDVTWAQSTFWQVRPEVVLAPTLVSTIGTEYGAFDFHLGVNATLLMPLWKGAFWDFNQLYPLNVNTPNFEPGQPFFTSQLKEATSRRMLHQLLNFPSVNTQARLSTGMAYNVWNGNQIETTTQSENGHHRVGILAGRFTTDTLTTNNEKEFHLLSYRYTPVDSQKTSTELLNGKFWTGDTGFQYGQKFWHGDTSFSLYIKRSRMSDADRLVSFAGIQFSIPLTPRKNAGFSHIGVQGGNQWTYTIQSRIMDKDNKLTAGYSEIPRTGDTLLQILNRDRSASTYYQSNIGRIKNAFIHLTAD